MTSAGIRDLHLSANEIDEVIALIREYADVFASSDVELGRTAVVHDRGRSLYHAEASSNSLL